MALEIGQLAGGFGILSVRRGNPAPGDAVTAIETEAPAPREQAPPLTGVAGVQPLSGQAIQALQAADASADTGEDETESDGKPGGDLSEEEEKAVRELKARDQEVRAHEAAHAAAGGQYAGAPTYTYTQGPDGRRYATGGEVSIDLSPGRTPEETARKADQIRAAALAPADPSGQDRAVAAAAAKMKIEAQAEGARQQQEEQEAKRAEAAEDQPAVPGAPKPDAAPEIAGPKPAGSAEPAPARETGPARPGADRAEAPALPGQRKAEERDVEIVGPKPIGSEESEAETGRDRRAAAAASAYSRTEESVSTGRAVSNALSLVA